MKIDKVINETQATLKLDGELESTQAKLLEEELNNLDSSIKELTLDLEKLDYTSSAGIRTFLLANKIMAEREGKLKLVKVNDNVYEILKMASLIDKLKPERA